MSGVAEPSRGRAHRGGPRPSSPLGGVLALSERVQEQLRQLTGRAADGVSRLERTEDGWLLQVEVVELDRVPQSTSLLASYEVHADGDGNVQSYQRVRRYSRNQAGER